MHALVPSGVSTVFPACGSSIEFNLSYPYTFLGTVTFRETSEVGFYSSPDFTSSVLATVSCRGLSTARFCRHCCKVLSTAAACCICMEEIEGGTHMRKQPCGRSSVMVCEACQRGHCLAQIQDVRADTIRHAVPKHLGNKRCISHSTHHSL